MSNCDIKINRKLLVVVIDDTFYVLNKDMNNLVYRQYYCVNYT